MLCHTPAMEKALVDLGLYIFKKQYTFHNYLFSHHTIFKNDSERTEYLKNLFSN